MQKKTIIIVASVAGVLILALGAYFIWGRTKITNNNGTLKVETNNIVTETVTYIDSENGITYEITKNKITKNARIDMQYPIADDAESTDFLGQQITLVPFTVNLSCAMFNAAFFDPESFKDTVASFSEDDPEAQPITANEEFSTKLEGYKVTSFTMNYFDKEDNGKIAKCSSEAKGNESIKFETYRDYSSMGSFFGMEIGVYEESSSAGN